jgi:OPA family sugar phosphate sensor protein UhpC-like MFS transporter
MSILVDMFKPPSHKPEISDQVVVEKEYSHWRLRVFYSMYIGYALYYLTRKCLAFAMLPLMQDLGYDKAQLGLLATILAVSYGISKFVSGLVGDRSNARYFMAFGLISSGIVNILFGLSSSMLFFCIFWAMNGWFQGFGWPACTRLLTHWYSRSERGRWWSLWATSQNVGGALIPLFTAYCAQLYGWRFAMIIPGVIVILGGFFLINRLCDTPQSLGLPSIEKFRFDYPPGVTNTSEEELSAKEILFKYVLTNRYLWILSISYFFVYLIRQAFNDWTVLYLVEMKGYTQLGAGATVFWLEIGGILGGLAAGWLSDQVFAGNRGPVCVIYSLLGTLAIYVFAHTPGNLPYIDSFLIFAIGHSLFGPLILIGIAAAELSHKKASATATGFTGCIAYLGAASAGYPLGVITQTFGWEGFFFTLTSCALLSALVLVPMWGVGVPQTSPVKVAG